MIGLFVFSVTENFSYTIASDKEFEECKKIHGEEKAEYEQRSRDVLYELKKWNNHTKCKTEPNHERSDNKNHFKYTRTVSTVVWIRNGNILYYNKT